jgi:hypothetical protein
MLRIIIVLFALTLSLNSDAQSDKVDCILTDIKIDKYGCVDFGVFEQMHKQNCSNMPSCFNIGYEEIKPKEYFSNIPKQEKRAIIETLDSSAVALLKNTKLKNIKIIFYNKNNKLNKDFINDAQKYLLEKGVEKNQFKIEIRE